MDLVCCICAYAKPGPPSDAETIIRGYAVCMPHAVLVTAGPEWMKILTIARAAHETRQPLK